MSTDLFIKIISGAVSIAIFVITTYLIPYLKSKYTNEQLHTIENYIRTLVRCAEQIYTQEQWKEKKEFVLIKVIEFVNDVCRIDLTREQLDALIEGIVNEVKYAN
ncbi:MAG: phage holin family protein [Clostridium sp.]|nr:phage holin family protein [Clostridium sp.]